MVFTLCAKTFEKLQHTIRLNTGRQRDRY